MPSFPNFPFTRDNVKVRFLEPTVSQSVNQRFLGMPRGVYVGYVPQVTNGSLILTLATDPRLKFSTLKVGASSTAVQVDIFTNGSVTLDFTGHGIFPVFVIARADYQSGFPTQGQILTRATGPSGPQEIAICVVDKPGANLTVSTTIPGQRQPPLAFSGQAFGYMYGGATDDIMFAQSVTAEVINARISLKTALPSANLSARLALDFAADYIAGILGLRNVSTVGNNYFAPAGTGSLNVSASFGQLTRQVPPALTIAAGGSEVAEGAITAPADTDRNVCFLINDASGERIVDATASSIYGRLSFVAGAIGGTVTFQNAQTAVLGAGTTFLATLQVGDLVLGADGNYYSVASITDNTHMAITPAYQGPNVGGFVSSFRRFTLNFFTRASGVEVAATTPTTDVVRFFFPAWFRLDRGVFDATVFMKRDGEHPVEPIATNAVSGRALLAVANALVGALFQVQSNQVALGANNFHTLNFTGTNASVTNGGGGTALITVPGNPGPPGPGALPGPIGPIGPFGPGARTRNLFQVSGALGPGGSGTFSINFAAPPSGPSLPSVVHLVGGFAQFDANPAHVGLGNCKWEITNIAVSGGTTGTLSWDLSGDSGQATAKVFLGATF